MSYELEVDIVIIGGGIAGLWLLSRLRSGGYDALLVEGDHLGSGQTISSQGIIHDGNKYALQADSSGAAQTLSDVLEIWRQCLDGQGEVDLSAVKVLAERQYLLAGQPYPSKLSRFFARKITRSRQETGDDELPEALRHLRLEGSICSLDEPVLDTASLLEVLAKPHREAIVRNQGPAVPAPDGAITLRAPEREPIVIRPRRTVFTAGIGNAVLSGAPMQIRPSHMVMVRGETLPGDFYLHCQGAADIPRLTITSHRDLAGSKVWYLGGQFAEVGVECSARQQINLARRELTALLPKASLSELQFASLRVNRAEARQRGGKRLPAPGIFQSGRSVTAWPTNLAMVPMLADEVMSLLEPDGLQPHPSDLSLLTDWPRPEVAAYPWDQQQEWY